MTFPQKWHLDAQILEKIPLFEMCFDQCLNLLQKDLARGIDLWQQLHSDFRDIQSYAACKMVENVENKEAIELNAKALELEEQLRKASNLLEQQLLKHSTSQIQSLIKCKDILFFLLQKRALAKKKMPPEKETLATLTEIYGYHSWNELYKIAYEKMRMNVNGELLSPGQIENLLANPQQRIRKEAFDVLVEACKDQEELFSQILRSITGFRLKIYKERGWDAPFFEAYHNNRISEKTVQAMWKAVSEVAPVFQTFLQKKKKHLGLKTFSWYDLEAPFSIDAKQVPYDIAAKGILEAFSHYSKDLADFSNKALSDYWIDAENRKNKAYGGFCAQFPGTRESRIFMTYAGTQSNALVLAHEIGHAYHNHVLYDLPELAQSYPETLAETASTAAELMLLESLPKHDALHYCHDKAQRSCTFFLNIYARYLFEQKLFQEARSGFVSSNMLCSYMLEAQKEAYGSCLDAYHPYFWITKIHFYLTDTPSYNFPYTAGYLLSLAIMSKARRERDSFEQWYRSFLLDTGRMSVEDIVKKHFGADAANYEFWLEASQIAVDDANQFIRGCNA